MGLRGKAPKPTELKRAQGNPGRRRLNEGEPVPPVCEVVPPEWLCPLALEVWKARAPNLIAMRVLTVVDADMFGVFCNTLAHYIELQRAFWSKGANGTIYTVKDKKGKPRNVKEWPQVADLRRTIELLIRLSDRFGLTPSARSRLSVGQLAAAPPTASPSNGPLDGPFPIVDFFDGPPRSRPPNPPAS